MLGSLDYATAQTSVAGQSTSTSSTTSGARKSFFDSASGIHWVFFYSGSAIEYSSSHEGTTWTSQGSLPYNTPNFSLAFKEISETSYVFLVTEAHTHDIVIRRGTISGTTITWESEVTVLDGSSASDRYFLPHVAFDANGKAWIAAFKDLGDVGDRYHLTARRTTNVGSSALTFDAASSFGKPAISVSSVAMVPLTGNKMLAAVSGESGTNVIAYEFDGTTWLLRASGGDYARTTLAGINGVSGMVHTLTLDTNGNLYAGGGFTNAGDVAANRIAKWNGTAWSSLGSGMDGDVRALTRDASGNLYAGGSFTSASGVAANRIAMWNGTEWSSLGTGMNGLVMALTIDVNGNLYAGGSFTIAGGVAANSIAKWNGTEWSSLGTGMNIFVRELKLDASGNLYAAGAFTTAGGIAANRIAKWNGSEWSSLGSGMNGLVMALTLDASGNLYAGGGLHNRGWHSRKPYRQMERHRMVITWNGDG